MANHLNLQNTVPSNSKTRQDMLYGEKVAANLNIYDEETTV
jgi:hypothetical protein